MIVTSYADLFLYPGQPAGEDRLLEIECAIGKRLPDDYRTLIRETGGGTLKLAKCVMPGLPGAAEGLATEDIFGNGRTTRDMNVDLATQATFLMEEWEIPREVLLFATTEDGMHNCFVINYDLPEYPKGSILYLNTDPGGDIALVANTFTEFINALGPTPNYAPTTDYDEDEELVKAQHYIQTGPPSPTHSHTYPTQTQ